MTGRDPSIGNAARDAGDHAEEAARRASPWVRRLARFGYAAKGVVYVVMGVLAVLAAAGLGGSTTDQAGVFRAIAAVPTGRVLLGVVAVGLAGYVLWRALQALADPDGEGTDLRAVAKRLGYAGSALLHAGLAFSAARLVLGASGGGGSASESWTARVLAQPFGWALVAAVGAGVVLGGLYQIYEAYHAEFRKYLKLGEMGGGMDGWIEHGGRFGVAARGVVFCIVGVFLVLAALRSDAQEVRGLGGALAALLEQPPYGYLLLGVVAVGLVAYGLLMIAVARYRRIAPSRAL
ncbi:DUF1206 domain-containing protein [Rubrobacter marinus]|uniref:DUF1206 domain-containing protein n=1 Tax=Rubrobacter marinus TaxID=2653852 RepID=A0A6G8PTL7_9ACTN|nr:DUF1206 domain-containing protein [Rubrobacter marinus]QIN77306.1 DUF1206 domain-containing protein [Rubrobacter marinus]